MADKPNKPQNLRKSDGCWNCKHVYSGYDCFMACNIDEQYLSLRTNWEREYSENSEADEAHGALTAWEEEHRTTCYSICDLWAKAD